MTQKTTLYLPADLKRAVEEMAAARQASEAEIIREAIRSHTERNRPRPSTGYFAASELRGEQVDHELAARMSP